MRAFHEIRILIGAMILALSFLSCELQTNTIPDLISIKETPAANRAAWARHTNCLGMSWADFLRR